MPDDPASILNPPARRNRTPAPVYRSLPEFSHPAASLDELKEIELDIRIELGRARMRIEDVLRLGHGSVVELNRPADGVVDVFANDQLVARGELVVLRDQLAVRIIEVMAAEGGA